MKDRFAEKRHDLELLQDLFDHVYAVMMNAVGTEHTVGTERVVRRETVLTCVEGAVKKAENEALDMWRKNHRKQEQP